MGKGNHDLGHFLRVSNQTKKMSHDIYTANMVLSVDIVRILIKILAESHMAFDLG